jgi:hypothetical protein
MSHFLKYFNMKKCRLPAIPSLPCHSMRADHQSSNTAATSSHSRTSPCSSPRPRNRSSRRSPRPVGRNRPAVEGNRGGRVAEEKKNM